MWTLRSTVWNETDKPVLVLVHSLGASHVMWDECLGDLAEHFRVVLLDLPGHGGSVVAPVDTPLSMPLLLDAIEATLDELGVGRFHMAGLSIGGMVTCAAAVRWGVGEDPRLLSVTVMASGAKNGAADMWVERAALIRAEGTEAVVDATMQRWFSEEFALSCPDAVERIRRVFVDCADEGYAQCCEILETTDERMSLSQIVVPFAVVNGSDDAGFGDQEASALGAMLVRAPWRRVTHIEGARHMCAMESPELAVRAIIEAAEAACGGM